MAHRILKDSFSTASDLKVETLCRRCAGACILLGLACAVSCVSRFYCTARSEVLISKSKLRIISERVKSYFLVGTRY